MKAFRIYYMPMEMYGFINQYKVKITVKGCEKNM